MRLTKPIIFFDLETTGVSSSNDRIVQIGAIKIMPVHPAGDEKADPAGVGNGKSVRALEKFVVCQLQRVSPLYRSRQRPTPPASASAADATILTTC